MFFPEISHMKPTAGYSATPLARKLGIKAENDFMLINAPGHYFDLFADFPETAVEQTSPAEETLDFIHLFVQHRVTLEAEVPTLKPLLKKTGMLWVSWPKGKSKLETDINREDIREYVLAQGLVDVKVAAVDKDWSGLKFVYRVKDR